MNDLGEHVVCTREGWLLRVELARPERRNAMTRQMALDLRRCAEAAGEPGVRAILVRGRGGHFCSGGDVADMAAAAGQPVTDVDPIAAMNRDFGRTLSALARCPVPVIAVCEGTVMGGGLGLAAVADVTLAVEGARFRLPETSLGITPAQILPFLIRRMGHAAVSLAVTGRELGPEGALRVGLATDTCASGDVEASIGEILEGVRMANPEAVARTRALAWRVQAGEELESLLDDASREFASLARGPGAVEGMTARLAKRRPSWAEA